MKEDFDGVGGFQWDNRSWGGEDTEFYLKCRRKGYQITRFCVDGLFHLWHPDAQEYKSRFCLEGPN
jgi:hypothetical protein